MYHSQTVICAHLQPSELCRFLATGRPTPARESPTPLTQLLYDYMGTDQAIPVIRKLVVHLEQSKAVSKYVKVGLLRLLTQIIHKSQVPAALAWGWAGRNPWRCMMLAPKSQSIARKFTIPKAQDSQEILESWAKRAPNNETPKHMSGLWTC